MDETTFYFPFYKSERIYNHSLMDNKSIFFQDLFMRKK